jgi:hypothetical protein
VHRANCGEQQQLQSHKPHSKHFVEQITMLALTNHAVMCNGTATAASACRISKAGGRHSIPYTVIGSDMQRNTAKHVIDSNTGKLRMCRNQQTHQLHLTACSVVQHVPATLPAASETLDRIPAQM